MPDHRFYPWVLNASAAGFLPTVSHVAMLGPLPKNVCFLMCLIQNPMSQYGFYVCCCCFLLKGLFWEEK